MSQPCIGQIELCAYAYFSRNQPHLFGQGTWIQMKENSISILLLPNLFMHCASVCITFLRLFWFFWHLFNLNQWMYIWVCVCVYSWEWSWSEALLIKWPPFDVIWNFDEMSTIETCKPWIVPKNKQELSFFF
jgi:hypothetical protein